MWNILRLNTDIINIARKENVKMVTQIGNLGLGLDVRTLE